MKLLVASIALSLLSFTTSTIHWENDFSSAKQTATAEHKFILLNFSGSDWCGPCIRLHKEIFGTEEFAAFAKDNLVMVNADFPRQKKNQLSKIQQQQNDKLADQYNSTGNFPFTLLLDANGKVVKAWDGFYKDGVPGFIHELKLAMHGSN